MPTAHPKKILIAPLDWGLGHTTRCVPIISYLLCLGHEITFAGNDMQIAFIYAVFKENINYSSLKGYNIRYRSSGLATYLSLLQQVFKIKKAINAEHSWLAGYIKNNIVDAVISDNRYGMHYLNIPSVIITHQLQIQTGLGRLANRLLQKIHYRYLKPFKQVWVPDMADKINLSGQLSHTALLPENVQYIGLLSQISDTPEMLPVKKGYLLILLSGPEPQRTIIADILWQQAVSHKGNIVFVAGNDNAVTPAVIPKHIKYYRQVIKGDIAALLQHADMVICRSGYSTLMDLTALNKKAVIIPTPGQEEQKYLGTYLHKKGIFYCARQKNFNLEDALDKAKKFPFAGNALQQHFDEYKNVLDKWLFALDNAKK